MATKRKRGTGWEYVIKRQNLLSKPIYLYFDNENDGDAYCERAEALLDRGIVPKEFIERQMRSGPKLTIALAIDEYLANHAVPGSDRRLLELIAQRDGRTELSSIDNKWSTEWVASLKRVRKLAPGTIRHNVGALARCFDWFVRERPTALPFNPLRTLPRGYSRYSQLDIRVGGVLRTDTSRERRLSAEEESRVRAVLARRHESEEPLDLRVHYSEALACLFSLALETAMRLREMYTLELSQVDFAKRTIFLDATKNGDRRQVPMSSVCMTLLRDYLPARAREVRINNAHEAKGREFLFPWFDGDYSERNLSRLTARLSQQFRRVFEAADCEDLRFHDLRHEATSRLYERTSLRDREIASITGHRDLRMLARYANLRGSELAARMW